MWSHQNVDNLHQRAGNTGVLEIHGDHLHLQCLNCGELVPVTREHYLNRDVPLCAGCAFPLKPDVVLFGESVRHSAEIHALIANCDLLMVVGTSAQVFPAAELPLLVRQQGGLVYEFNMEQTRLSGADSYNAPLTDFFFQGDVCKTMPCFVRAVVA